MEKAELKAIVENLLLAADQPVSVNHMFETFLGKVEKDLLRETLKELKEDFDSRNHQIMEVAGGFQLCTRSEYSEWIKRFLKLDKTSKLSQPALDTLSIIAYKQPLTRAEVEEIRGVDSSGVVKTLLEKKIICPGGRKKVPGRPILYRTTRKFLQYFGLQNLGDLPTLEDFKEGELLGDAGEQSVQTDLPFEQLDSRNLESGGNGSEGTVSTPPDPAPEAPEEESETPLTESE